MEESNLVQALAIWGAVTGTIGTVTGVIGLILRYRAHKRDNPCLQCESDFSFEHSAGEANPKHKIIIRSVGRRPVAVDYVRYFMRPGRRWHRVFKWYHWSNKRWVYDQSPRRLINLAEGTKENILITVPNGFPLGEVQKVEVHDQAGKVWKVSWPRQGSLQSLIRIQGLDGNQEENERQQCKVKGYLAGEYYYIYAQWNQEPGKKSSFKGRLFRLQTRQEYDCKWKDLIDNQIPRLLREDVLEIQ
ncbi:MULTISPECIES: hypothetical protein [unclassified Halomonas]|uniref:hypothetical protein n=1 Tax=unclassified Halomonas TaxID=2609666 RepID=UPI001EF6A88A|nr:MULTISPECIES: hypothetical protein [unclassified Halomonas]MCP1342904.1 hypothetical protein [Halomonas sp. FL8]MCP1362523.1 hypothetical protein [Halomonas sp. BBD45]MCP1363646.1 hypothetical protein [Halomonas sp. BBD48]